jgi:hypothetical protein
MMINGQFGGGSKDGTAPTDASHGIAITGMFNAHHTRARLSCHQEPIHAAQSQLQVPRTTVR